ncbi:hypothetical protein [Streptomyces sp. NPDC047976]|uniref:hypothetical protein n=1 Tax=Streptomyces sp. NPDC047976 TaxID=3155746 RepID=UPI00343DD4EC
MPTSDRAARMVEGDTAREDKTVTARWSLDDGWWIAQGLRNGVLSHTSHVPAAAGRTLGR